MSVLRPTSVFRIAVMKNNKAQPTPHTEVPLTSNHNHLVHHASSSPYVYFLWLFASLTIAQEAGPNDPSAASASADLASFNQVQEAHSSQQEDVSRQSPHH